MNASGGSHGNQPPDAAVTVQVFVGSGASQGERKRRREEQG